MAWMAFVGMAISAAAAIKEGRDKKHTAEMNAELMERQAAQEKDAAVAQAERIRRAGRAQQGEANAALAASGVSIGEGSAVRINEKIGQDAENDAYMTILTGDRRATSLEDRAGISRWQGNNAQTAGYMNAAASVMSSYGKMQSGWAS